MIKLENLKKSYGKKLVLDIDVLEIPDGKCVGIFGANGSGKSTLIKCMTGLLPYEGNVFIDGKNIAKDPSPIADVGILVEEPALYKFLSGRENIKNFCQDISRLDEYAKILGVSDLLDKKAKSYSLGMKQKIGILLACVKGKKVVILDEPFNCLDILSIEKAIDLITVCKNNGANIIMTSHQLELSQKAIDTYYLIKDKKIYDNVEIDREGTNVYAVDFASQEDSAKAFEILNQQNISCQLVGCTVKIQSGETDIFEILSQFKELKVKKFEDISNSLKEAYIAMEEVKDEKGI